MMRVSVLMAAYNEERTIAAVLSELAALDVRALGIELEFVICDDGSTDRTSDLIAVFANREPRAIAVGHRENRGKGCALRTALGVASGEYVLVQDADLEYQIRDYGSLLGALHSGGRVVYGSRFLGRGRPRGMAISSYLGNRILTGITNLLYGSGISDEATCLKLIPTSLLRQLGLRSERFEFCSEVTAKLGLLGVPVVEVPVRYCSRNRAEGKKLRWSDGLSALLVLLRCRFWRPSLSLRVLADGTRCRFYS